MESGARDEKAWHPRIGQEVVVRGRWGIVTIVGANGVEVAFPAYERKLCALTDMAPAREHYPKLIDE